MKARKFLIAGSIVAAALGSSAPVLAQTDYVSPPGDQVLGTELSRTPTVASTNAAAPSSGSLPVTGGDVLGLAAIGAAAVGTGAVMVRRSRRTAESTNA